MNKFEQYIVELLQGNIVYEGQVVEVRRQFMNAPRIPVITLDVASIVTEHVDRLISEVEQVVYVRDCSININLWCNTEEERENISQQIMQCFYDEQNCMYPYCTNYNKINHLCASINTVCPAYSSDSSTSKRRCPNTDLYGFQTLTRKHDILWGTVNVEPPFSMDELGETPPLLRNIFQCEAVYEDYIQVGGRSVANVQFKK